MPKDCELAKQRTVHLNQLKTLPLILAEQTFLGHRELEWFGSDYSSMNIVATYTLIYNATFLDVYKRQGGESLRCNVCHIALELGVLGHEIGLSIYLYHNCLLAVLSYLSGNDTLGSDTASLLGCACESLLS